MSTPRDPREIITPESFTIDPALLGRPLARPGRRAAAMMIDLVLVALLVWAGGFLFGVAAAWVFLRVSSRIAPGGLLRRTGRFLFRAAAALILFIVVMNAVGSWRRGSQPQRDRPAAEQRSRASTEPAASLGADLGEHPQADDPEVSDAVREGATDPTRPGVPLDSVLDAYVAARDATEPERAESLLVALRAALAADTAEVLAARERRLTQENRQLRAERDQARRQRGILSFLRASADDLGLTFGWSGLYFTAFLALWNGQTPGKRMVGIRVLRLDGKPMTWWASFERFGGYAASIFTGLLGFVQIFWDRNRQGMHDKITETVVVRL